MDITISIEKRAANNVTKRNSKESNVLDTSQMDQFTRLSPTRTDPDCISRRIFTDYI